jgi:hypothetical protein
MVTYIHLQQLLLWPNMLNFYLCCLQKKHTYIYKLYKVEYVTMQVVAIQLINTKAFFLLIITTKAVKNVVYCSGSIILDCFNIMCHAYETTNDKMIPLCLSKD